MAEKSYVCVLCGHEFQSAETPKRCPECLSANGLQENEAAPTKGSASPQSGPSGSGNRGKLVAVAVLIAAVVAAAFLLWPKTEVEVGEKAESKEAGRLASTPDEKAYVESHLKKSDAARIAAHFAKLAADGAIKLWNPDEKFGRQPMKRDELLQGLGDEKPQTVSYLEMALAVRSVALVRGLKYEIVEEKGLPDTATSPVRKRILARINDVVVDPWSKDGVATTSKPLVVLTNDEVEAFRLALLAISAAEKEDMKAASSAVLRATKLAPSQPSLQFLKGQIAHMSGMVQFGIEDMEKAIATEEDSLGRFNLATAYIAAQRLVPAHEALRRAIELDPNSIRAWLAHASLQLGRISISPEEKRESLIAEAKEAVAKARTINPEADGVAAIAAQVALASGDERGAFVILEEAVTLHPDRPQPYILLASLLANKGKWAELVAYVKRGLRNIPEDTQLRHLLIMAYLQQGRPAAAISFLEDMLAEHPEFEGLRVELAGLLEESGEHKRAREVLDEELKRFPDSEQAPVLRAQLDLEDGKIDEAIAQLDAVLARGSAPFEVLVLRYIASLKSKTDDKAQELLRLIAAQENGRSYLAQILLEQGMAAEGVAVLKNILADRPNSLSEAVLLVAAYTKLGREEDAKRARAALLEKHGDEPGLAEYVDMMQAEARRSRAEEEAAEKEQEPEEDAETPAPAETDDEPGEPAEAPAKGMPTPLTIEMPKIRMPSAPGEKPADSALPSPGLDLPKMPELP